MALPAGWVSLGVVAESGQAWVYRVRGATNEDGELALKRLKNPRRSERFAREVRTMIRLRDELRIAVPAIEEFDLEDERPWFVMPWYSEGSLQRSVDDRRFAEQPRAGLATLIRLAEILSDVHAAGVAHRDLKPANVLRDGQELLLTDFGLCLVLDDQALRLTDIGEAVGSRLYIAPENEAGINPALDQRPADFYAYGKVLWALLAGRDPPPREMLLEPECRLATVLAESRLAPLDGLLRDLLAVDPRARLVEWSVVTRELNATDRALAGVPEMRIRSPRERARWVAERFQELELVKTAIARQDDDARRAAWVSRLLAAMRERAQLADRSLEPLAAPVRDLLTMASTTGGPPTPAQLQGAGVNLPVPLGSAVQQTTPGLDGIVFYIHSPRGIEGLPTLTIRVWLAVEADSVWIARVATMTPTGESETVAQFLLPHFLRAEGPMPLLRQATIDTATSLIEETAQLFVTLCETYLAILDDELDPTEPDAWSTRDLSPASLEQAAPSNEDTHAPDLRSFAITPTVLPLSEGAQQITIRARIVDDLSGNADSGTSQARLVSRSGQFLDAAFSEAARIDGDALDGTYEINLSFDARSERGHWRVEYVLLADQVGNMRRYQNPELLDLGFATGVELA